MSAGLTIEFDDPTGAWTSYDAALQASLQSAWQAWTGLFDWTAGSPVLHVKFASLGAATAASSGPDAVASLGRSGSDTVEGSSFARAALGGPSGSATLTLGTEWLTRTFPTAENPDPVWLGDDTRVFEHEFMHMLGAVSYLNPATQQLPGPWEMAADQYVSFASGGPVDTGPYAESVLGGPVPLDPATLVHPLEGGGDSVLSYLDPAHTIQTLDIAMLRDDGVPVLFPDEARQHQVIRLLDTLDQVPDGATVASDAAALAGGESLTDLAAGMLPATAPDDPAGFVAGLWANAMGSAALDAGDAADWTALAASGQGAQAAVAISESDAHRAALAGNPDVSYAAAAGEQVFLLFDAAFGVAPDPAGYASWTGEINAGASPAQVALELTRTPVFVQRYDGLDDAGFANALYGDTLHGTPDTAALQGLADGSMSRADLLLRVADDPAHVQAVAAGAASSTVAELGLIPTPWIGQTQVA